MEGSGIFQICAFIVLLTTIEASVIKFEASPSVLKANLTSSASMRCSLADTDVTGSQIGKRSVTSTADDISHISAIYVTRNNDDNVASISLFDGPIVEADHGNLEIKGDLSGSSKGYLELTWTNPSAMAMGEYVCEINTVTTKHHSVLFTSTLELTSVAPTINDVVEELKKQQVEMKSQQAEIKDLRECASRQVGFMAVMSNGNDSAKTVAIKQPVVFDKVIYSVGGSYDETTGQFTCLEPGIYSFSVHAVSYHSHEIGLELKLNSNIITSVYSNGGADVETGSTSALVHLKRNDIIHVSSDSWRPSTFYLGNTLFQTNVFVGHMVKSDCVV